MVQGDLGNLYIYIKTAMLAKQREASERSRLGAFTVLGF
jgi:hypothetical protein